MLRSLIPFPRRADDTFLSLRQEMNRLFDNAFAGLPAFPESGKALLAPSIDVKETDKTVEVEAELPGVDQKDVSVTYADGALTIKGEKKAEKEEKKAGYHFAERAYGSFMRSLAIDDVDADKITANFDKGVLKVTLPKLPAAAAKTKKIEIQAGK